MKNAKTILIIDHSMVVKSLLQAALEKEGFVFIAAENGLEGILQTYRHIPDVIIMNTDMPQINGFQTTRILKNTRGFKDIPVIIYASPSEESNSHWAMECGADAFFIKDFKHTADMIQRVVSLSDHGPYPMLELMKEESTNITIQQIITHAFSYFEGAYFQHYATDKLMAASQHISSLEKTVSNIFEAISYICPHHIALIAMRTLKKTLLITRLQENIVEKDIQDFSSVCLSDFFIRLPNLSQESIEETILNIENRSDFHQLRINQQKIQSYLFFELKDTQGELIGTLHLGHCVNHYFTAKIASQLQAVTPQISILLSNALSMRQLIEKESKIRTVFAKFLPMQIIENLIEKPENASLLIGEKRSVAILFSDIRSFTTISENNTAEDIVHCLNQYFDLMAQAIQAEGGIIDKFIGDAILAIFGAPTSYEDNTQRAARAAANMTRMISSLQTGKLKLPKGGFQIGIGITDGIAIVGNIGSKEKFEYTAIGDIVNLAARLESLTKYYYQQIIISEEVKRKIGDLCTVRELDQVKVKGKEQPTAIYSILPPNHPFTPQILDDYQKGLQMYKIKNWLIAIEYFKKVLDLIPEDYICDMYIMRCQEFIYNPPSINWDGSIELDFK